MKELLLWWSGAELVGLAAFPLTYAFFRWLPDRGYAFSKVIGLLLLGYGVWMGAVIGLFQYGRGSVILVLLGIAGLSVVIAGRHRDELGRFVRSGSRYILFVEVLFFAVLAGAVFIRSFAPEIVWGEKQFELAFLNSINRSEVFPPEDPWLAGHPISYYYFGFVIVSALSKLVALGTNVTFYLALSLMAALASVTAFGLVYNMIAASRRKGSAPTEGPVLFPRAAVFGLAASGLMLIVSNLSGIFELMARHGIGSKGFYGLVNIEGLDNTYDCAATPGSCSQWYPTPFWWWWKATRMGSAWDVQEFPFFSFQFGDLHPHVLVIPFLLTALAVALAVVLGARADHKAGGNGRRLTFFESAELPWRSLLLGTLLGGMILTAALALEVNPLLAVPAALVAAAVQTLVGALAEGRGIEGSIERLDPLWWLRHPGRFLLVALLLGGIAFIDAWAVPLTVLSVIGAAIVANWLRTGGRPLQVLGDSVGFAMPIVAAMYAFFLPFYLDLDSAVEGVRVNQVASTEGGYPPPISESTRPLHFLLFWMPILWVALSFLVVYLVARWRELLVRPFLLAPLVWAAPIGLWAAIIVMRDGFGGLVDEFSDREASLITALAIIIFITAGALAFLHELRGPARQRDRGQMFAFQLAVFAFVMMLGAELFYVKDLFSWRVNTVFRFWHQSWIILAIVGGFGLYQLTLNWRLPEVRLSRAPWLAVAAAGIAFGAGYAVFVAADPWDKLYSGWWTATLGLFVVGAAIVVLAIAAAARHERNFWPVVAFGGVAFGAVYTVLVDADAWSALNAEWWTATLGLFVGGASIVAFAVTAAVRATPALPALARLSWLGVTVVILAAALVYPVTVTLERTNGFRNDQSLNGLAHIQKGNPQEYDAVEWLNDNLESGTIILEAVGTDYSDFARVSAFTGLPTVMGWPGHELQWRGYGTYTTGALVETSLTDVQGEVATIYNTTDVQQALDLMDKYEVEYVYVGWIERREYEEAGLSKFRNFMLPVFENDGVVIYRMPVDGTAVARAD
jgi:uncharacterized membrane protein